MVARNCMTPLAKTKPGSPVSPSRKGHRASPVYFFSYEQTSGVAKIVT